MVPREKLMDVVSIQAAIGKFGFDLDRVMALADQRMYAVKRQKKQATRRV